jgi:hypothetical protein
VSTVCCAVHLLLAKFVKVNRLSDHHDTILLEARSVSFGITELDPLTAHPYILVDLDLLETTIHQDRKNVSARQSQGRSSVKIKGYIRDEAAK